MLIQKRETQVTAKNNVFDSNAKTSASSKRRKSNILKSDKLTAEGRLSLASDKWKLLVENTIPELPEAFLMTGLVYLAEALEDCENIDEMREKRGMKPCHLANLVFEEDLRSITRLTEIEIADVAEGKDPRFLALRSGDEKQSWAKFTLHKVRESIRDGWSCDEAIIYNQSKVEKMLKYNDSVFFIDLGDLLRGHTKMPLKRSLLDWIVRAWLPLRLWECGSNGIEAHSRFVEIAELYGDELPGLQSARNYPQFLTAWRKARSQKFKVTVRRGARPRSLTDPTTRVTK